MFAAGRRERHAGRVRYPELPRAMTSRLRHVFSFPLLAKELTEAAARPRTYRLRVIYAVLLYAVFGLMIPSWAWNAGTSPLTILGAGHEMFETILILQFVGIGLFLPGMMCGRITQEKERDSLVLLFLTDLRPWSIVLEKYLGGLVPMLSFLLLAMPIAALAYAFGGMTGGDLANGLYVLLLGALQVGALALMFSAWCRTTVSAFLCTYVGGAAFYGLPPLVYEIANDMGAIRPNSGFSLEALLHLHLPPVVYVKANGRFADVVGHSGVILLSIVLFLTLARIGLVRRAFTPPSNFFLRTFRRLDGWMHRANRLTGGTIVLQPGSQLPDAEPIAWRELSRKGLGQPQYLVRILLALEIPVVLLCLIGALKLDGYSGQSELHSMLAAIVGTLAVLALSVQAANAVVSERVQQTLELLLTTPLTAREIVLQKARALRRFMWVLAIPLLTIFGTECWIEHGRPGGFSKPDLTVVYIVCSLLTLTIYLPLVSWLSLWIGLKMRTRFKAIMAALAAVVGWAVGPIVILVLSERWPRPYLGYHWIEWFALLSPLTVVGANEFSELHQFRALGVGSAWLPVAVNFAFYGLALFAIRHRVLSRAERYLRG